MTIGGRIFGIFFRLFSLYSPGPVPALRIIALYGAQRVEKFSDVAAPIRSRAEDAGEFEIEKLGSFEELVHGGRLGISILEGVWRD